jgi:hypothetical protein
MFPTKTVKLKSFKDCLAELEKQRRVDLNQTLESTAENRVSVTESGIVRSGKNHATYTRGVEHVSSVSTSMHSTHMVCKGKTLTVDARMDGSHP